MAGESLTTRRALLGRGFTAGVVAAAALVAPRPARAADSAPGSSADDPSVADNASPSDFTAPYTAWAGYATTMAGGVVPGSVPVSAPATADEAWSIDSKDGFDVLALRQIGQSTFAYVARDAKLKRIDVATGSISAQADLDVSARVGTCGRIIDAVLVFLLADGTLAAYDEDLNRAWVSSEAMAPWMASPASRGAVAPAQIAEADGVICVATSVDEGGSMKVEVRACSSLDGGVLWQQSYDTRLPAGPRAAAPATPAVFAGGSGFVLADGVATVRELDAATGEQQAAWQLADGATSLRMAEVAGGIGGRSAFLISSFNERARATDVAGLVLSGNARGGSMAEGFRMDGAFPLSAPLAFGERAALVTVPAEAAAWVGEYAAERAPEGYEAPAPALHPLAVDAPVAGGAAGSGGAGGTGGTGGGFALTGLGDGLEMTGLSLLAPCWPLAVAMGVRAAEANVDIAVQDAAGRIGRVRFGAGYAAGDDGASDSAAPVFELLRDADESRVALDLQARPAVPLVARDGSLVTTCPLADGGETARLTALKPDASRAQATHVGGAEGLDTIASSLGGVALPNGAGLGAGVAVFAVAFGAYAWIRNRGGRAREDEGLSEWRARNRDDDGKR